VLQSRMIAHGEKYPGGALATTRSLVREGGLRIFARGCEFSKRFSPTQQRRVRSLTTSLLPRLRTDPAVLMRSFPVNALLLPVADVLRGFFERALPDPE